MKTSQLFVAATFLILTGVARASEISDTTPPQLVSLAISPAIIDASTNSQLVLLTVRLTDDLSGMTASGPLGSPQAGAWASFRCPAAGVDSPVLNVRFVLFTRDSGDDLDGVYTSALIVPRFSHAGNWTLFEFDVTDAVGNHRQINLAELRSHGFPTGFTVQGADDHTPPEILSAAISPTTVDTSSTNQPITITVRLRDDLAGMDFSQTPYSYSAAQITFISPSRGQRVSTSFATWNRTSGDEYDGIYTNTIWLPRYSEPGIWSLDSLVLIDAAGNHQQIDLAAALDIGLQTEFTVEGTGDMAPPQIRALDFSPRRIDTSSSNQTILVTARLFDALSGMGRNMGDYTPWGQASVTFLSPSKGQTVSTYFNAWTRADGSEFDGVYTNTMILPRYSERGVWSLQYFGLVDAAGNNTNLALADLRQLGFPTEFAVGIAPSLKITPQADSLLLSWPAWAVDFTLQSRKGISPSSAWVPAGPAPVVIGDVAVVAVPIPAGPIFYRLAEKP
jgi:hypothetical protein